MQHPAANGRDQAARLGKGDELVGPDQAALGVLPAHQGLEAGQARVGQAHLGLVVQGEFVLGNRLAQLAFQAQFLVRGAAIHARLVELAVGAAAVLGVGHGHVGVAQ